MNKTWIFIIYFVAILIFFFRDELLMHNYYVRIFERTFVSGIFAFIILEQSFAKKSFFKMSNYKRISKLGLITYGLYCLHFIGILIAINMTKLIGLNTHLWQVLLLETTLALLITIVISKISFKYLEKPFLKLKDRFSYIAK